VKRNYKKQQQLLEKYTPLQQNEGIKTQVLNKQQKNNSE